MTLWFTREYLRLVLRDPRTPHAIDIIVALSGITDQKACIEIPSRWVIPKQIGISIVVEIRGAHHSPWRGYRINVMIGAGFKTVHQANKDCSRRRVSPDDVGVTVTV